MGYTLTEKIFQNKLKREVKPGEFVELEVDFGFGNDITAPLAIEEFEKLGMRELPHHKRIAFVLDHFTPNKDVAAAEQCRRVREFAQKYHIENYFEGEGIEHIILPEKGLVLPGEVVIGADSHTCTYGALGCFAVGVGSTDLAAFFATGKLWFRVPESMKFIYYGRLNPWVTGKDLILYTIGDIGVNGATYKAIEFCGETISSLGMSDRFTMCNMAVEAGAKTGLIEPDEITVAYLNKIGAKKDYRIFKSSQDATYAKIKEYDVSKIEPQVAFPNLPSNTKPISEVGQIEIDQVVIGSCTNGRIEDLRMAAWVLKKRHVHRWVRLIVIPGSQMVYQSAIKEGLIEIFIEAGGIVCPPSCGPCLGGHMGILARGERAVATTNRNFTGRMGHRDSEVYLTSPAVAAASAILGRIGSPNEI